MALTVKGHRLLVKPDEVKAQFNELVPDGLKNAGFEVAITPEQERREKVGTQIGTVIQIGNTCWKAFDGNLTDWEPWCNVGDRITFARYSGKVVEDPVSKEQFMIINDEDVHCVVTGEKSPWED